MEDYTLLLANLQQRGLFRQLRTLEPLDAGHVRCDDRELLLLASNNYLAMTHHPEVIAAACAAAQRYGTGSGGARLTTGNHPEYALLETTLARFKGTEAAVVFNTGYMANVGTISALMGPGDTVFSDEWNHASIIDGCRLSRAEIKVFRHNDPTDLEACLQRAPDTGRRLIVVDGVFSMDGDIAPLALYADLAERYGALLMVDDAHATGVIGPGGKGTAAHQGCQGRVHIQMGTLSKALGAEGGFVAASRELVDVIINRGRSFIFSTALAPATVAAGRMALAIVEREPERVTRLGETARQMRRQLIQAGLRVEEGETPIIPIVVGEAEAAVRLAGRLQEEGLLISAIRPPTVPAGTSRLRLTVTAAHRPEELRAAAGKIIDVMQEMGLR